MRTNSIPAGWYPDPDGKPSEKYWDGNSWSEQSRPLSFLPNKPEPQQGKVGLDVNEKVLIAINAFGILVAFLFTPF